MAIKTMDQLFAAAYKNESGIHSIHVGGSTFTAQVNTKAFHDSHTVTVDSALCSITRAQLALNQAYIREEQTVISIYQMLVIRDRVCGKQVQDVGGYRFEVDRDEQGRPKYLVNGNEKTLVHAESVLRCACSLKGATIQPHEQVSPMLYLQQVGRAYRQPRNESEVHETISRLLTDLSPTLFGMLNDHMFPQGDQAEKLRNLLHLNEHGTFPLATN